MEDSFVRLYRDMKLFEFLSTIKELKKQKQINENYMSLAQAIFQTTNIQIQDNK